MTETETNSISVGELANTPREIQINGRTLKVRQLKLKEMFGYFEVSIQNKKLKEAERVSSLLKGKEKTDFLLEVWKNLPKGEDLFDLTIETMCSIEGIVDIIYMASKDFDKGLKHEDINNLISTDTIAELTPIIRWINGQPSTPDTEVETEVKDEVKDEKEEDSEEKKT